MRWESGNYPPEQCRKVHTLFTLERSVSREDDTAQMLKKFPALYGDRKFSTVFPTANHPESGESSQHLIPIEIFFLILSWYLCTASPDNVCIFLSHLCYILCLSHASPSDYSKNTWQGKQIARPTRNNTMPCPEHLCTRTNCEPWIVRNVAVWQTHFFPSPSR